MLGDLGAILVDRRDLALRLLLLDVQLPLTLGELGQERGLLAVDHGLGGDAVHERAGVVGHEERRGGREPAGVLVVGQGAADHERAELLDPGALAVDVGLERGQPLGGRLHLHPDRVEVLRGDLSLVVECVDPVLDLADRRLVAGGGLALVVISWIG